LAPGSSPTPQLMVQQDLQKSQRDPEARRPPRTSSNAPQSLPPVSSAVLFPTSGTAFWFCRRGALSVATICRRGPPAAASPCIIFKAKSGWRSCLGLPPAAQAGHQSAFLPVDSSSGLSPCSLEVIASAGAKKLIAEVLTSRNALAKRSQTLQITSPAVCFEDQVPPAHAEVDLVGELHIPPVRRPRIGADRILFMPLSRMSW